MNNKSTVVVLAGGISHERDISLRSGRRIADALNSQGHRVLLKDSDAQLVQFLRTEQPAIVVPMLHGASGEDGSLLEVLNALKIPFIGGGVAAARRTWQKPIASAIVSDAGLTIPPNIVLSQNTFRELGAATVLEIVTETTGSQIVVKPASGGSAQGVTILDNTTELSRAIVKAFAYDSCVIIERLISGTEVALTVLDLGDGAQALPAVEIEAHSRHYDFEARYSPGLVTFHTPARLANQVLKRLTKDAITAHNILGLRDISRLDFIVDTSGTPWFLEANALPGLTETSSTPLAIDAAGTNLGEIYSRLIATRLTT